MTVHRTPKSPIVVDTNVGLNGGWFELTDEQVGYITEYLNELGEA